MEENINQNQRAFATWEVLKNCAVQKQSITYKELGEQIDIHHRAIRIPLHIIQNYCLENELPPLSILVFNQITGLPGDGFIAYDIENSLDGINKVYDFNWVDVQNPFLYAKDGVTQTQLIDDIIRFPEKSVEVFAKIKVRGISQQIFRKALLKVYKCSCAICGFTYEEALEASHIVSYSQANSEQRLDVRNGLLLCSIHHKLFDSGCITINQDYSIEWSLVNKKPKKQGNYDSLMTTDLHRKLLKLPLDEKHLPNKKYLQKHQKSFK